MGVVVRGEGAGDRWAVRAVNEAAFGGCDEADLVLRLHDEADALFGLVAEVEGLLVGHVLFSRLPIEVGDRIVAAAALAPLAVLPGRQGQGIGSALVWQGLDRCRERRVSAVVVLGNPAYYGRFGFHAETAARLQTPWPGPNLMAIELIPGGLAGGEGVARYAAAFSGV